MVVRIFQNAWFRRFVRREKIKESVLTDAIARAEQGRVDTDLGGGVIKQRIARPGQGKSGGYRTIIIFRKENRAFFIYGFAKSDRENIAADELEAFKELASKLLSLSDEQIESLLLQGGLTEIKS
ncbi:MAG: type II toxin-antitoxin system RelE/ParE family toxin [Cyanobacteriota bacterium]|nr:type II toxin-antitoxin system RelE/ParE family toxin [Cyanobacteriota bacterium]